PLRLWSFSDGLWVIRATPRYERALRCRVVAIQGHDIAAVRKRVRSLFAGNESWAAYMTGIYLTRPDVLTALKLIPNARGASITFEGRDGRRFDLWIESAPVDETHGPSESWQEISPVMATGDPSWRTAITGDAARLPLYLRQPARPYWFEFDPGTGLLYL